MGGGEGFTCEERILAEEMVVKDRTPISMGLAEERRGGMREESVRRAEQEKAL